MTGIAAAIVGLLLIASALLSASWEAVSSVSKSHLRTLEEEGFEGAEALSALRESRASARSVVLLLTSVFNLTAVAVMILTGISTWGAMSPAVSAVAAILIVLFVAGLLPHAIAVRRPVRIALSSAPALQRVVRVVRPLTAPVTRVDELEGAEAISNEHRELREIQEIGEEEGILEESENRLVERAFRLDELTAWDVMIPRVDIFAWKEELTLREVVSDLSEVPYSRVPVYKDSVDDVTGIVYVREMYERVATGKTDVPLSALAREPFFVPGSLSLTQLLQDFQARRIHMGIVADEFGGTDGLVTLEDILEELVGEIHDETDVDEKEIERISEAVVEAPAGVDVRDLDEALGVSLPKVEHRSLNGLILEELGQVPEEGATFDRGGVRFEILEASETQVLRARLTRLAEPDEAE